MIKPTTLLLAVFTSAVAMTTTAWAEPRKVEVTKTAAGWQLLRDGKPYFVKGAGGSQSLQELAKSGGNSIRTWGSDKLEGMLDEADKLGLTVCVGFWVGHERHGFNYNDDAAVADQLARAKKVFERYKNHPAVLMWGIGNEMEGYKEGDNPKIWKAIEDMAKAAHEIDPNHPTMTVTAEIGGKRVPSIHQFCPDIDIVGINSYGGATSIPERYQKAGGSKPYILTEYGPPGTWEIGRNKFGLAEEWPSTEKAKFYKATYEKGILGAPGLCLGGYAFTWGFKQEATATWYGMFLHDGSRLAAVDTLTEMWSGKPAANRCPAVGKVLLDGPDQVGKGATVKARVEASDPDGDAITYHWRLFRDLANYDTGGDFQAAPEEFPEAIAKDGGPDVEVKFPADAGGAYRLFVEIHDGKGNAAVSNVPLKVEGAAPPPKAVKATVPFEIYGDAVTKAPYVPSGYMGNTAAIKMDGECPTDPHSGKTCLKVSYTANANWAGVVWQSPANDWGNAPGGFNIVGGSKLTFWARGEKGGEKVKFGVGIIGTDKKFHDSGKGEVGPVELTPEWKQYTIDLSGRDLSCIKSGFYWTLGGQGQPVTFYLDDIRFE